MFVVKKCRMKMKLKLKSPFRICVMDQSSRQTEKWLFKILGRTHAIKGKYSDFYHQQPMN